VGYQHTQFLDIVHRHPLYLMMIQITGHPQPKRGPPDS
jgi:hypothetical protein